MSLYDTLGVILLIASVAAIVIYMLIQDVKKYGSSSTLRSIGYAVAFNASIILYAYIRAS